MAGRTVFVVVKVVVVAVVVSSLMENSQRPQCPNFLSQSYPTTRGRIRESRQTGEATFDSLVRICITLLLSPLAFPATYFKSRPISMHTI